jgi:DNA-binding MarR family transcriptional regulator
LKLIPFWLVHVTAAIRAKFDSRLEPYQLKTPEAIILRAISLHGSLPLVKIAKHMAFAHPSVLRHIDALEKRGLIQRRPHPEDRRVKLLYLTAEGDTLISKVSKLMDELNLPKNFGITRQEHGTLLKLLQKVHAHTCKDLPNVREIPESIRASHDRLKKKSNDGDRK